jgi:hypothetical protein
MNYPVTIGGEQVLFTWNQGVARRYRFRLGSIGGHPTQKELRSPAMSTVSITKLVWALLPPGLMETYPTPEDLFCDIEDDAWPSIQSTITGIYSDMNPNAEKKITSTNSPSPE